MTISLLNIFDSRGLGFVLLEALIEHEVEETGKYITTPSIFHADRYQRMRPSYYVGTVWQPKCSQSTQNGKAQCI